MNSGEQHQQLLAIVAVTLDKTTSLLTANIIKWYFPRSIKVQNSLHDFHSHW